MSTLLIFHHPRCSRLSLAISIFFASSFCFSLLLSFLLRLPCSHPFLCHSLPCHGVSPQDASPSSRLSEEFLLPAPFSINPPFHASPHAYPSTAATDLSHIVFGIAASSRSWKQRKEYVKLWWRHDRMRGFAWLDAPINKKEWDKSLPPWRLSENVNRFKYTNKLGRKSAIRISRIVSETFRLKLPDVHWFVMGDDDTVFIPENLVSVLSKYDHRQHYYIGSSSESHLQNINFSYNMAFGGGGFAISYPLAEALEKRQDECLNRYPALYGSDDRIQACMAELGFPLTKEPGFHQFDVRGNLFGLLAAHPVTPAVSFHHFDALEPLFPNRSCLQSLQHLDKATQADPAGLLQQSICYDPARQWSISISWGFAVQIYRGIIPARELEMPSRTFYNWHRKVADDKSFVFNTRPVSKNPCAKPVVWYMSDMSFNRSSGRIVSDHTEKKDKRPPECRWKMASPEAIDSVRVVKQRDDKMWEKAPRRKCCRVVPPPSSTTAKLIKSLQIEVQDCDLGEIASA